MPSAESETESLLASCILIDVADGVLRHAAELTSESVKTLDAIHLASALRIDADELLAYDRRLAAAGAERGLAVASPGTPTVGS